MANAKLASQVPAERKHSSVKGAHSTSLSEQTDIEHLIEQEILHTIAEYDPKLDFRCVSITADDQVIRHRCRQTYGLIWNAIRSANVSRLVPYDRSHAFVEILRIPANWSRYDTALLLQEIRHQKFLNGLALRDELVRVLQLVLKRDFQQNIQSLYELDELQFTRNSIQLTFHRRRGNAMTLIVSFVLLVEFDVSDTYTSLCEHEAFREYFQNHPDVQQTHLTPSNSIKFRFDSRLLERKICDYLIAQSTPFSCIWTNFLKLRKQWPKHVSRAVKYATEISRKLPHPHQLCASLSSKNLEHSTTSNAYESPHADSPLSIEIEEASEYLFSIPSLRLLYLTACAKSKAVSVEHAAYVIIETLQSLAVALESSRLAHPFLKNTNVLTELPLIFSKHVQLGISRLINDMQREWKRSMPR